MDPWENDQYAWIVLPCARSYELIKNSGGLLPITHGLVNSNECPSLAQDCPTCKEIREALNWKCGKINYGEKVCPFGDNFANLNKFVKWLKLKKVWVPPKEEKSSTFASGPLPFLPKAGSSAKKRKRG